jgi:uncharacterized protein YceK
MRGLMISLLILLAGCATVTQEERDQLAYDQENWAACKARYAEFGRPTVSQHRHQPGIRHTKWDTLDDLALNYCRQILGGEWAGYRKM